MRSGFSLDISPLEPMVNNESQCGHEMNGENEYESCSGFQSSSAAINSA